MGETPRSAMSPVRRAQHAHGAGQDIVPSSCTVSNSARRGEGAQRTASPTAVIAQRLHAQQGDGGDDDDSDGDGTATVRARDDHDDGFPGDGVSPPSAPASRPLLGWWRWPIFYKIKSSSEAFLPSPSAPVTASAVSGRRPLYATAGVEVQDPSPRPMDFARRAATAVDIFDGGGDTAATRQDDDDDERRLRTRVRAASQSTRRSRHTRQTSPAASAPPVPATPGIETRAWTKTAGWTPRLRFGSMDRGCSVDHPVHSR